MMASLQFCGQSGGLVWGLLNKPIFYNQTGENFVQKIMVCLQEILKKNGVPSSIKVKQSDERHLVRH
jgi:hypothetical protein